MALLNQQGTLGPLRWLALQLGCVAARERLLLQQQPPQLQSSPCVSLREAEKDRELQAHTT